MAFYILYEAYRYETNVQATGISFENVVYSSFIACMQTNERLGSKQVQNAATDESAQHVPTSMNNLGNPLGQALPVGTQTLLTSNIPTTISPDFNYRAEYKLLTDILVSVPKIKNEKIFKFISSAECP